MKIQAQLLVEFDTDNPLGIEPGCLALRKLVAEIDPGLTVYLQTIRRDGELTHNYLPDDISGTISG